MGTPSYFIWIGISFLIIGIMIFISLKFKFTNHTAITVMCIVSILSELLKVFTHIDPVSGTDGDWSDGGVISAGALPLHLCSIFIFIFFFLFFNKKQEIENKIINFFVPIGLIGAIIAIFTATSGVNFARPYAYQCFIYHSFMVWLALYFIITKKVSLGIKQFLKNVVILFVLSIIMIWVNGALQEYDTNFFYVVRPPISGLPFLNLNDGWFAYYLKLLLCGLIGEFAVCLPYIIKEAKQKNNIKN